MSGGGDNRVQETPEVREASEVAREKFLMYTKQFVPIENWYQGQVAAMNTGSSYRRAAGVANVEGQRALGQGLKNVGQINPNTPKFSSALDTIETEGGALLGSTAGRAIVGQQNQYMQGMGNIASIGLGQGAQAQVGLDSLANNAQRVATQEAEDRFNSRMQKLNLVGTVAGVGGATYADLQRPPVQQMQYPSQQSSYGLRGNLPYETNSSYDPNYGGFDLYRQTS